MANVFLSSFGNLNNLATESPVNIPTVLCAKTMNRTTPIYLVNKSKFALKAKYTIPKKITKFEIIQTWIVRQFKHEFNPIHWHGGHISGAGFLKVPKILGDNVQKKKQKQYRGGNLQLIHGARMFTCPSTYNITPQVGDFYIFPNYLMHTVFPFKDTDEERRSISFNGVIDEEIYNVYGK